METIRAPADPQPGHRSRHRPRSGDSGRVGTMRYPGGASHDAL